MKIKNILIGSAVFVAMAFTALASVSDYFMITEVSGSDLAPASESYAASAESGSSLEGGVVGQVRATVGGQNYIITICNLPCNKEQKDADVGQAGHSGGPSTSGESGSVAPSQGNEESNSAYQERMRERAKLQSQLDSLNQQLSGLEKDVGEAEGELKDATAERNQAAAERNQANQENATAEREKADAEDERDGNKEEKEKIEGKIEKKKEELDSKTNARKGLVEANKEKSEDLDKTKDETKAKNEQAKNDVDDFTDSANEKVDKIVDGSELENLENESQLSLEERLAALEKLATQYEFETSKSSEHYYKLHSTQKKIENARALVAADQSENRGQRDALLDNAEFATGLADQAYSENDSKAGDNLLGIAIASADLATDFIPGVSAAKDAYKIWTGKDPFTGEKLTKADIALLVGGYFAPAFLSGTVKGFVKLGKHVSKLAGKGGKAGKLAKKTKGDLEAGDEALGGLANKSPCVASSFKRNPLHWLHDLIIPKAYACPPLGQLTGEAAERVSKTQHINGKPPRNAEYAGLNYSLDVNKNPVLRQRLDGMPPADRRIRERKLAGLAEKYPEGVNFSEKGFPDFNPYVLSHNGRKVEVDIGRLNPDASPTMKNGSKLDMADANRLMREEFDRDWKQPPKTTWHHIENSTSLQLVPSDLHGAIGHSGGRNTYQF